MLGIRTGGGDDTSKGVLKPKINDPVDNMLKAGQTQNNNDNIRSSFSFSKPYIKEQGVKVSERSIQI